MNDRQQSLLVFRGGPLDGKSEKTKPGWPAPNEYISPDNHKYARTETVVDDEGGVVRHFYDWEGRDE